MINELKNICKETVLCLIDVLFRNFSGVTEENEENPTIVDVPAESRDKQLLNIGLQRYCSYQRPQLHGVATQSERVS
jgi:hypothetical protein